MKNHIIFCKATNWKLLNLQIFVTKAYIFYATCKLKSKDSDIPTKRTMTLNFNIECILPSFTINVPIQQYHLSNQLKFFDVVTSQVGPTIHPQFICGDSSLYSDQYCFFTLICCQLIKFRTVPSSRVLGISVCRVGPIRSEVWDHRNLWWAHWNIASKVPTPKCLMGDDICALFPFEQAEWLMSHAPWNGCMMKWVNGSIVLIPMSKSYTTTKGDLSCPACDHVWYPCHCGRVDKHLLRVFAMTTLICFWHL